MHRQSLPTIDKRALTSPDWRNVAFFGDSEPSARFDVSSLLEMAAPLARASSLREMRSCIKNARDIAEKLLQHNFGTSDARVQFVKDISQNNAPNSKKIKSIILRILAAVEIGAPSTIEKAILQHRKKVGGSRIKVKMNIAGRDFAALREVETGCAEE